MNANSNKGKILIIDDDENMSRLLQSFLTEKGFTVITVFRSEEAERNIDLEKPDLIFLDYRMSPITGKDILERLRIRQVKIPVVMISAYKRRHGDWEMRKIGAMSYLPKPFDFDAIDRILSRVFRP